MRVRSTGTRTSSSCAALDADTPADGGAVPPAPPVPSGVATALWLTGLVALSTAVHVLLVRTVTAPSVFADELGYWKLARSIGREGRFALFGNDALAYAPLYPALLAPLHALDIAASTVYAWTKTVNALLISLSAVPTYGIARFVLSRREALVAAGVSLAAPLTFHSSFVTAENLAYPLGLVALWAMLATLRSPSVLRDAVVLGGIAAAAAAKYELFALVPAALTAVALAAVLARGHDSVGRPLGVAFRRHWLLVAGGSAALAGAVVYAVIDPPEFPSVRGFAEQAVWHVAALDLAVGVVPFVGALVAAYAFFRSPVAPAQVPFAAVSLSVTVWVIVALAAGHAESSPPLHERSLIYVVPLFVVALLATVRLPDASPWPRVALLAAVPAALLPAALPFDRAIDLTTVVDTFALQPLARIEDGALRPIPHVVLTAVLGCLFFGLAYGVVRRISTRAVVALVLIAFVFVGMQTRSRIALGSDVGRVTLPWHRDWVDRAAPTDDIVLITDSQDESAITTAETLFFNDSITSIYAICGGALGPDFDERTVALGRDGSFTGGHGVLRARSAVVPDAWDVVGDVLATNFRGGQVLVRPARGLIRVPENTRAGVTCG